MWTQAHDSSCSSGGVSSAAVAGPSPEAADPTYNVDDLSIEHELEAELKPCVRASDHSFAGARRQSSLWMI